MTVVCFDISLSNTGVAIFDEQGNLLKSLSIGTDKEKGHPLKLKKIEKEAKKIKKIYKPAILVGEDGFSRFNKSTQAIYKARGIIELVFWDIKQTFYSPKYVRKVVMGNGNAKKEQVQEFIQKNYNENFKILDESDAFAVGLCYFKEKGVI